MLSSCRDDFFPFFSLDFIFLFELFPSLHLISTLPLHSFLSMRGARDFTNQPIVSWNSNLDIGKQTRMLFMYLFSHTRQRILTLTLENGGGRFSVHCFFNGVLIVVLELSLVQICYPFVWNFKKFRRFWSGQMWSI